MEPTVRVELAGPMTRLHTAIRGVRCAPSLLRFLHSLSSLRNVVQYQKLGLRTRGDRIGAAVVITEFHKQSAIAQHLHDGPDLAAGKTLIRQITEQRDDVQKIWLPPCDCLLSHHRIQQVTSLGLLSLTGMIQMLLIVAV